MHAIQKKIRGILGHVSLPLLGLLIVFLVLTILHGIQQVVTNPGVSWDSLPRLVIRVYSRVITFQFSPEIWFLIKEKTWRTLVLVTASVSISLVLGIVIGTLVLMPKKRRLTRWIVGLFENVAAPFPSFLLALVVWFSLRIPLGKEWPQGETGPGIEVGSIADLFTVPHAFWSFALRLIAPALVLAFADGNLLYFIETVRYRSKKIGEAPFVRHLRDSGYSMPVLVFKHILPHALVDITYLLKYRFAYLLSSAAVVEIIFARPGIAGGLVTAAFYGRGSFELVAGSVWFLSCITLCLVVAADAIRQNASAVVVRGYYPIAKTVYDTARTIRFRFLAKLGLCLGLAFSMHLPAQAQGLFDPTPYLPPFALDWPAMGNCLATTLSLVLCASIIALALSIVFGVLTGLMRGGVRSLMESGCIAAFDIVPKFFMIFTGMFVISSFPFFEGSINQMHAAVGYCLGLAFFCWNETARSIAHRMHEIQRSGAYASAVAIGCSRWRMLSVYYFPAIRHEAALGFLKIVLTVLFMEGALAYCGAGIDRFTYDFRTVASFINGNIKSILFMPPYAPVILRYAPSMIVGGIVVALIVGLKELAKFFSREGHA